MGPACAMELDPDACHARVESHRNPYHATRVVRCPEGGGGCSRRGGNRQREGERKRRDENTTARALRGHGYLQTLIRWALPPLVENHVLPLVPLSL